MGSHELTATAAAAAIRAGTLTSEQLVRDCLARIEEAEPTVRAWTFLDPQLALEQARAADRLQRSGAALGALHGLPVGVKDIFDTADMPTENGTVLHAGRRPAQDATVVARLRRAGAVILGKTVTTELAVYAPGKTTNPHDPRRTPGGSSSGSAAAVAARMVPLAIGTQTNGSVLRPASYCGVVGYKPSHGAIPRDGVLKQSSVLDHVGVFARTVEDCALVAGALSGVQLAPADGPLSAPPRIAFVQTPVWPNATPAAQAAFTAFVAARRDFVRELELPPHFDHALACHRTIMVADLANNFEREYATGRDRLSPTLREMIEEGQRVTGAAYSRACDTRAALRQELQAFFAGCDAILTPATAGSAPLGLASTGSPMFCTIWTLCGAPAISLPILRGEEGMPLGAQLVAAQGQDAQLLRVAKWLAAPGERA